MSAIYENKTVLLIGGGGTLGTYTGEELLRLGCAVDVLCPEEKVSHHPRLCFHRDYATEEVLAELLRRKHYDGIVNFIHYTDVDSYRPIHRLLTAHTDHLIFLSSYRVYADEQHPITETAPQLLDVTKDEEFLATETYALAKARCERFLREEDPDGKWTIVRPVISFSHLRFDLVTYYGHALLDKMQSDEPIPLPCEAKDLTAGLDWAGNSGKLIAHLLFKEDAVGEAFTVSSAQGLTWGDVAQLYTELCGATFEWVSLDEYLRATERFNLYALLYDRLFDRAVNNEKILRVTGLTDADFTSVKEGLQLELKHLLGGKAYESHTGQ